MLSTYRHLPGSDRSVQEIAPKHCCFFTEYLSMSLLYPVSAARHVPLQYCETGTVRNNQTSQLFSLLHNALRQKSSYLRKREGYF